MWYSTLTDPIVWCIESFPVGIFLGVFLSIAIVFLWYSPLCFFHLYLKATGLNLDELKQRDAEMDPQALRKVHTVNINMLIL